MKQFTMTKPHSPHLITFSSDPNDSHFVDVRIVRKSTGETKASHYILRSDLSTWVSMYEGDNFEIVPNKDNDNGKQ